MSITRFMSDIECIVCYTLRCCMDKSVWTKVSGQKCLDKSVWTRVSVQETSSLSGTPRAAAHDDD